MKRTLVFILLLLAGGCSPKQKTPVIEYQGETFRLTRSFSDYDEYKQSPDNLLPEELDRIETKILSVQIPNQFSTKQEFVLAALKVKFPGYGFGGLESPKTIYTATIEIPKQGADRYITAIEKSRRWFVIDDFKGPTAYGGTTVQIENGQLIYRTYKGAEFRRIKLE
ncbi:MAG TPA: hypothetical protein VL527_13045 [Dongiaceae bacterium]|jgi:hypothetical protein|nr:hypothetical protein [Dongiaceae bacterium]